MTFTHTAIFLAIGISMFFVVGCSDRSGPPKSQAPVTTEDVKEEVEQAVETVQANTQKQMEAYQVQIDEKLKTFDEKLSELGAKAESMQEDAKAQYIGTISTLQRKQMEATAALKGLKNETGKAWAVMKERLDEMVDDLQASFDRADTSS
jgi:hypothetical protein